MTQKEGAVEMQDVVSAELRMVVQLLQSFLHGEMLAII